LERVIENSIFWDQPIVGAAAFAGRGTGYAKDIVPWRKTDFEQRAACVVASLPATVVREGKILYDAG
jgi:hypothetical protein